MLRGLYAAASALITDGLRSDVLATNLANVQTPGFKVMEPTDGGLVQQAVSLDGSVAVGSISLGDRIATTVSDWSPGTPHPSTDPLSAAIIGSGFFVVQTPAGLRYTRAGDFRLGAGGALVTPSGAAVLGQQGPIRVSGNVVRIEDGGAVTADGVVVDRLRVVTAANPAGLEPAGFGLYRDQGTAGLTAQASPSVRGGMLESSNVDPVREMVQLLELEQAYGSVQRLVGSVDATLSVAVNQVGKVG